MKYLSLNEISLEARIHQMRRLNYRHVRSGWRFQDEKLTDLKVVEHIAAEVVELAGETTRYSIEPDKSGVLEEIADTLNTLYHLMIRFGITQDEVFAEAHRKLDLRFEP